MIRNWTGESTEEVFFELADEYGMLVWNDFWMSTEGYNLAPLDNKLLLENSLETIRRFRNHPSIAIWCPRNEGYAPAGIEDELYLQLTKEDGTRHYIGNSREINLRPSGDWHYIEDPALYFTKYADGFSTEIGTFSVRLLQH
jgi:beta-galactosidase/beta-glucuronidase